MSVVLPHGLNHRQARGVMFHNTGKNRRFQRKPVQFLGLCDSNKIRTEKNTGYSVDLEDTCCQWRGFGAICGWIIRSPTLHHRHAGDKFQCCWIRRVLCLYEHVLLLSPVNLALAVFVAMRLQAK